MTSARELFSAIEDSAERALQLDNCGQFDDTSMDQLRMGHEDLHKTIAVLNRVSNSRRPVDTLPDKVLLQIFLLVPYSCSWPLESGCRSLALKGTADLRNLTLVCHKWRELALSHSPLWTTLYLIAPTRTTGHDARTCLGRHQSGPISVHHDDSEPLDLLNGEEHRVVQLEVETRPASWGLDTLPAFVSCPMTSLERLVVRCPTDHSRRSSTRSVHWMETISLFGGGPLPLRFLSLTNAVFLPGHHQVSNLTHLGLWFEEDTRSRCSVDDIIHLLSKTPMLQEAVIHGLQMVYPEDGVDDNDLYYSFESSGFFYDDEDEDYLDDAGHYVPSSSQSLPVVELRHLRKFSAFSWVTSARNPDIHQTGLPIFLLQHLQLPRSCYVRVDACTPAHISFLMEYLKPFGWDDTRLHCVYGLGSLGGLERYMSIQLTDSDGLGGIRVDITRTTHVRGKNLLTLALRDLLSSSPFVDTKTLLISGKEGMDWDGLLVLHVLANIKEVVVYPGADFSAESKQLPDGPDFMALLGSYEKDPLHQDVFKPTATVSFPLLDTVYLPVRSEDDLSSLHRALRSRRGIPRLIVQCLSGQYTGTYDSTVRNCVSVARARTKLREVATANGSRLMVFGGDRNLYEELWSLSVDLPPVLCGGTGDEYAWTPWLEGRLTDHTEEFLKWEERSRSGGMRAT